MRQFDSGATRDSDEDKLDYDGFLDPRVERSFAEYMHHHRLQADGKLRASDNWKKGIPTEQYMKSKARHHREVWETFVYDRQNVIKLIEYLNAEKFNINGLIYELLKEVSND